MRTMMIQNINDKELYGLYLEQRILIPEDHHTVQEILNWPPGEEWFVNFSYIREDDQVPTKWQKLLWFKYSDDSGCYLPMFQSQESLTIVGAYIKYETFRHIGNSHPIPPFTVVKFGVEQRRDVDDGKLYISYLVNGVSVGRKEINEYRSYAKVRVMTGNNKNNVKNTVSEFKFGKL